jgi:hypothetical protein
MIICIYGFLASIEIYLFIASLQAIKRQFLSWWTSSLLPKLLKKMKKEEADEDEITCYVQEKEV